MTTPIGPDFASKINNFTSDIAAFKQNITDSLLVGNSMYGPYGHAEVKSEVSERTKELTAKKEELRDEIKKQEAIIHRSDRDFTDVRHSLPETLPENRFHFIEDYTLVFVLIAYLFMIVIALHTYVLYSTESFAMALGKGLFYSFILTLISGMILYFIS
jgi:hypothetical protein